MLKFKIGFTVESKTLFKLLASMLPIEDLTVEEIMERYQMGEKRIELPQLKVKRKRATRIQSKMNLEEGVNKVIMSVLYDGQPHSYKELKAAIAKTDYSSSGVGSRLDRLRAHKIVAQAGKGQWQLMPKSNSQEN